MRPDQERVQSLLKDTVTTLCRNSLLYDRGMKVQGLLGITLDDDDVFIVHFNEIFQGVGAQEVTIQQADSVNLGVEQQEPDCEDLRLLKYQQHVQVPTQSSHRSVSRRKARPWRAIGGLSEPSSSKQSRISDSEYHDSLVKREEEQDQDQSILVDDNDDDNILGASYSLCEYPEESGGDVDIMKQSYMTMKEAEEEEDMSKGSDEQGIKISHTTTLQEGDDQQFTNQGGPFIAGIVQGFPLDSVNTDTDANTTNPGFQFESAEDEGNMTGISGQALNHIIEGVPEGIDWDHYTGSLGANRRTRRAPQDDPEGTQSSSSSPGDVSETNERPTPRRGMMLPVNRGRRQRPRRAPNTVKALYKCKDCGKTYWSRNTLVRHQKVHDPELYACKKCTLFFPSEDKLLEHDKGKHSGPIWGRYMCKICNKKFRSNNHLIGHMNTFHAKEKSAWTVI